MEKVVSEDQIVDFALRALEEEAQKRRELSVSNTTIWMRRRHRDVAMTCWQIASLIRERAGINS